ncbi:MAG: hypothetical protein ACTHMP_05325, partial [Thermomicrobiales bacterium]
EATMLGTRGPVTHQTTATRGKPTRPPIDLAALTDQQLAIHAQGLYARLDTGYAACERAPDDATRLRWEAAWGVPAEWDGPRRGVLAEYEAAVRELNDRKMGE